MEIKKLYIDGEWTESPKIFEVTNPFDGNVIGKCYEALEAQTEAAIQAAKKSFYVDRTWRDFDNQDRSNLILKIADRMEELADELAYLDCVDSGKPLREAEGDISDAINCFRYYAGAIKVPSGGSYQVNKGFGEMHTYTIHEPVGVVAQITPWNYPLLMSVWKLAPALAAGNSVVFKPSPKAPLSTIRLFEIFDEVGLPKGCCNLLQGDALVGTIMSKSKDVDMIAFTGSTKVGQLLMANAATNIKKIGLELGGKSPNVIFDDVDLDFAVEWAMIGIFFNQGEVCSAGSRIIIHESIKDSFLEKLKAKVSNMKYGNPLDNPDIGSLISRPDFEKVMKYIETGKNEGATLVCGGRRHLEDGCENGLVVEPTVFADCHSDMTIVKEEIFGPVVTVQTFKSEQEAIELANDTPYGLAGAVFCKNISKAMRVVREIRAGITWVNCYNPTFNEAPWGGYKMSGIGRELGIQGLEEYQEIKQININLTEENLGWYEN